MLTMRAPTRQPRPVRPRSWGSARIEHEARRGRVQVQAVRESCGEQDGFGPDRDKAGCSVLMSTASAPAMRPPTRASSTTMMVVELYADRLGLADKHLLLVGASYFRNARGLPGRACPLHSQSPVGRMFTPQASHICTSSKLFSRNLCMRLGSLSWPTRLCMVSLNTGSMSSRDRKGYSS